MSRVVGQLSDLTADWRWLFLFVILGALAAALTATVAFRRRPNITEMPSTLFRRHRQPFTEPIVTGPAGGKIAKLAAAPNAPAGPVALPSPGPPPPRHPDTHSGASDLFDDDEIVVTIDLTELESEEMVDPVVDLVNDTINLSDAVDEASALPADPWA